MAQPHPEQDASESATLPSDLRLGQLARDAALDARNLLLILQAYLERFDERFAEADFRHELQDFIQEAGARVDGSLDRLDTAMAAEDQVEPAA